jgi:hypothetical protein
VTWRIRLSLCAVAAAFALHGCSDSFTPQPAPPPPIDPSAADAVSSTGPGDPNSGDQRPAILKNVLSLIRSATTDPGGPQIDIAAGNLNHYFEGVDAAQFRLPQITREFLAKQVGERGVNELEAPTFRQRDGRHIEDCLLYQSIASRVAGDGDDLTRTRRVFEWVVRNVALVPPVALAPPGVQQAQARPYDVLLRGMATEVPGTIWAERSWVFMSLCRQIGIDVGLIVHPVAKRGPAPPPGLAAPADAEPDTTIWICGAAIGDQLYLFDSRIGMEIPGPDGKGVATFAQAASDPSILERLDLSSADMVYPTRQKDLAAGPIVILFDSSVGYLSGRMRLLEKDLSGADRMVLYRDAVEQAGVFQKALGDRFGGLGRWDLPLLVDTKLFTDPKFVEATQYSLLGFESRFPLLPARISQLRGTLKEAIQSFVEFRFAKVFFQNDPKKTPVPPPVQGVMNMYATYFLALAKLENKDWEEAEFLFQQSLTILPLARAGGPPYSWLRLGATANLARLYERKGDYARAARYYAYNNPTTESHGRLVRARDLIWRDPMTIPPPEVRAALAQPPDQAPTPSPAAPRAPEAAKP